ncbi:molybdopterin molybdotransferase MoeA [Salinactinospora qingdaonensis]|uniref:Molybdopterin molybdenumtransferase n=1 Tax=Salinactinospora qingdaonensis TaxID=702744 RepID=A0ABP7FTI8_9ACTN
MRVHRDTPRPERAATERPQPPVAWERARGAARDLARSVGFPPCRHEPLQDALGATLAEDLVAGVAIPFYDTAAMDGYAVAGPAPWTVVGEVPAGAAPTAVSALQSGQAMEIATGAPVPEGTEAVLPYEEADRDGAHLGGTVRAGRHIRRTGEDTATGETVLPAGSPVTPAVLGLAASLAHDTLPVLRPRVTALVTGDELIHSGAPAAGAVRDAIGPVLPGLAGWAGAELSHTHHVADDRAATVAAFRAAAEQHSASVIVACGASSVGRADHVRAALTELGATVLVEGVACRPGHPQLLAHLGAGEAAGPIVVGLPGNPNAALAAALTLLVPVLAGLSGRDDPTRATPSRLPLRGEVAAHPRDTRLVAVALAGECAYPVGHDRPATLRGAAMADALAVVPPGWSEGEVELLRLPH